MTRRFLFILLVLSCGTSKHNLDVVDRDEHEFFTDRPCLEYMYNYGANHPCNGTKMYFDRSCFFDSDNGYDDEKYSYCRAQLQENLTLTFDEFKWYFGHIMSDIKEGKSQLWWQASNLMKSICSNYTLEQKLILLNLIPFELAYEYDEEVGFKNLSETFIWCLVDREEDMSYLFQSMFKADKKVEVGGPYDRITFDTIYYNEFLRILNEDFENKVGLFKDISRVKN